MTLHKAMLSELGKHGGREPNTALNWWRSIENSTARDLSKRKLYFVILFVDVARAYLSIQASSASAEHLFGDAGYQEGTRRQPATIFLLKCC